MGTEFDVSGKARLQVRLGIPGAFNVENALAAVAAGSLLGVEGRDICRALQDVRVNGRMEIVHKSARMTVLVDYAHNAVSMESLLTRCAIIIRSGWYASLAAAGTDPRIAGTLWARSGAAWRICAC